MGRIPPEAKRVFAGQIFEVWQWEQKMFDGSTATFECLRRPNTATVIPVIGNKILISEERQPDREKPFTTIPGGRCEWGEDGLVAAKRELLEETGYSANDWTLFQELRPVGKIDWTIFVYVARDCQKIQEPHLDAGEQIQTKLITFNEFLMLADDETFSEKNLVPLMLRARLNNENYEELRRKIFGA